MTLEQFREVLAEEDAALAARFFADAEGVAISVEPQELPEVLSVLRQAGFEWFEMVTATDRGESFELVYRLESRRHGISAMLRTHVTRDDPSIRSAVDLWPAANWQEREIYDMFGIVFEGHPDLRRILLPDEWAGFPLRKDYVDERMVRRPDYI